MSEWLERYRGYILLQIVNVALVGVLWFCLRRPAPVVMMVQTPVPTPMTPTPAMVRVYVCGAVARPDVYSVPRDAIVKDALLAAGGTTAAADLTRINLALPVQDGDQIYVPAAGDETAGASVASPTRAAGSKININKASYEELLTLPGIGETYARRIIEYRKKNGPFARVEDLQNVEGIGAATVERLRSLITLQ